MTTPSLRRAVPRLEDDVARLRSATSGEAARLVADPVRLMAEAGMTPDDWQRRLLTRSAEPDFDRALLLCTRQGGKSTTTAALALRFALARPGALILLLSPSLRQSAELFLKLLQFYRACGEPVAASNVSALRLELVTGARVIALPGTEKTVRGFSGVDLLVIDEAARVDDDLYLSVRPMLAVSGGRLVALTTPWGKRGWFYDEWTGTNAWDRVRVTAPECPRITPEFLAEERASMPAAWYRSEYLCEFADTVDQAFTTAEIDAAFSADVSPLFASPDTPSPAPLGTAPDPSGVAPLALPAPPSPPRP